VKTARTFLAALLVPGLGFVLVDRVRLGMLAVTLYFVPILIFSLSRLILVPAGYYALIAIVLSSAVWSVIYSTRIAYSDTEASIPNVKWAVTAVFALLVVLLAWSTVWNRATSLGYETFSIPSGSMSPTLAAGDYILVDTWHFSNADPQVDDLVVFDSPGNPGTKYVKRVVGVPGDTVGRWTIGPDEFFVLGDNRDNSRDSRNFGPVPRENISGRVSHLWYSSTNTFPVVFQ